MFTCQRDATKGDGYVGGDLWRWDAGGTTVDIVTSRKSSFFCTICLHVSEPMVATLQNQRSRRGWESGRLPMLHIADQRFLSASITSWQCTPRRTRPRADPSFNQCVSVRVRTFVSLGDSRDSGVVNIHN